MNEPDAWLNTVTFAGEALERLPYSQIREVLQEHPLARVTGLFDADEVLRVRRNIEARFDARNDRKHDPRDTDAVRTNMQKLQIGAVTADYSIPRFLRMLFNPIFADDAHGMRDSFIKLARFRNLLYELPRDFAVFGTEKGLWTASRLHQYPRGGGFMAAHIDDVTKRVAMNAGLKDYYQMYLLMSKKGVDFFKGGAFIDRGGRGIEYEAACEIGDIMVYSGRSRHGVADIDPLEPLDLVTFSGRVVAMVTLFAHLQPSDFDVLNENLG
ncbi:MAG: hypothetical protein ACREV9_07625 [Burkholderiales bacterium]